MSGVRIGDLKEALDLALERQSLINSIRSIEDGANVFFAVDGYEARQGGVEVACAVSATLKSRLNRIETVLEEMGVVYGAPSGTPIQ